MSTPPGWYDDGSGAQRWWDGTRWAEQPPPPPPPPPAPPGRKQTGLVVGLVVALVALVAAVVVILVLVLGGDDDDRDDSGDGDRDDTPSETASREEGERPGESVTRPSFDVPTDADEGDFCAAMQVAGEDIAEQSSLEGDETVDFGVAIEVLRATGTPSDIPDDARAGFEAIIEAMEAGDGLTVDEFEEQDEAELEGEAAFSDYYTETCASF